MPKETTQFKKGGKGGPGRPPGFRRVAKMILEQTRDGAELVEFFLRTLRDDDMPHRDRVDAAQWLADRGLGKPLVSVDLAAEIGVTDGPLQSVDLSKLSIEALQVLDEALAEAEAEALVKEVLALPEPKVDEGSSN